jgi:hypothetical protein
MTILSGNPMSVTACTMKIVLVSVIMAMVTNSWPDHFIPQIKSNRFPEIPEPTFGRLTIAYSFGETAEYEKHENGRNDLQQHEFCYLQPEDARQHKIQRTVAVGVCHSARNVEPERVADMMKMISFMFGAH